MKFIFNEGITQKEIDDLYNYCVQNGIVVKNGNAPRLDPGYRYNHLPLALIDSVFKSTGHKFKGNVENVIMNFGRVVGLDKKYHDEDQLPTDEYTIRDLLQDIAYAHKLDNMYGAQKLFSNLSVRMKNNQKVYFGYLIYAIGEILLKHNVNTFADFKKLTNDELDAIGDEIKLIHGIGNHTWESIKAIAGNENYLYITPKLRNEFLKATGNVKKSDNDIYNAYIVVAKKLNMPLRNLDNAITRL